MKREVAHLLQGIEVDWRLLQDVGQGESFADLVVVKFKGTCQMEGIAPYLLDERGPLAYTHTSDGQVLPFSEVACDKVRLIIRSAMYGNDYKHADLLLGRALGRILAHELYHIRANTRKHEKGGVNRRALTAAQLIADREP